MLYSPHTQPLFIPWYPIMSDQNGHTQPNSPVGDDTQEDGVQGDSADEQDIDLTKETLDPRTTAVLSKKALQRHMHPAKRTMSDIHTKGDREVIIVIRGIIERFVIPGDRKVTLGRADTKMRFIPDIDLTPYGALDRGVSRVHANLWIEKDHIFISDAGSTNGTYIDGDRLEPEQPHQLARGDEIMLGRLAVQILFR